LRVVVSLLFLCCVVENRNRETEKWSKRKFLEKNKKEEKFPQNTALTFSQTGRSIIKGERQNVKLYGGGI